jgi:hypothetical protein
MPKRTVEQQIAHKRKAIAMHHSKSEERLEFEAEHDCYLMIVEDGGLLEVFINGERYYKARQHIDSIIKVDPLDMDGTTTQTLSIMRLRTRFNGQRNQEVYGVWLPKEWAETIKKHQIHEVMEDTIIKYKFEIK